MAHRTWGSVPHFALCNSLFWREAVRSHRGDRSPGHPSQLHGGEQIFARLVVEAVRRLVGVRVERTHNRSAACIRPIHGDCSGAEITAARH